MADLHGPASAFLLVDGYNLTASKIKSLRHKITSLMEEGHGIGDLAKEQYPVGVIQCELAQEGAFFDTATGRSHEALSGGPPGSPQATERIVCFGYAGQSAGEPFDAFEGEYNNEYEVLAERDALQKANTAYVITGRHDSGVIIQELATKTASWDTEAAPVDYTLDKGQRAVPIASSSVASPTVITTSAPHRLTTGDRILISGHTGSTPDINGEYVVTVLTTTTFTIAENVTVGGTGGSFVLADSSNGGAGYLQCTAASGFTNFVGKIRDSADDITYADLVTFTDNVSAPFAERVEAAGQVDRYLAFDGVLTGTGSITVFCGFGRF